MATKKKNKFKSTNKMYISVSITAAPFDRLGKFVEEINKSDADAIHFDISDATISKSLIFCPKAIKDLRPYSDKPFDVHLAMSDPTWMIDQVAEAGANACAIQWDYCNFPRLTLEHINRLGMNGGVAIRPKSEIPDMSYAREFFDYVIVQTVEPCPSYQFLPYMVEKLKRNKSLDRNKGITWFMDGDINMDNLDMVIHGGVDALIIGSLITKSPNIVEKVREIKERITEIQNSN